MKDKLKKTIPLGLNEDKKNDAAEKNLSPDHFSLTNELPSSLNIGSGSKIPTFSGASVNITNPFNSLSPLSSFLGIENEQGKPIGALGDLSAYSSILGGIPPLFGMTSNSISEELLRFIESIQSESFLSKEECIKISSDFNSQSSLAMMQINNFHFAIGSIPFLCIALLWASGENELSLMPFKQYSATIKILLEKQILSYKSHLGKQALTLREFVSRNSHEAIIDSIRCCKEWSIGRREEIVFSYLQFTKWLSIKTIGYIKEAIDIDRHLTEKRKLPYNDYIRIIQYLSDRELILAKIFYLGGSRSLEEVLSLKIDEVNYLNRTLCFAGDHISYPKHVFADLQDYIGVRTEGYVFVGRDLERIDHTVPYRALKTAASKLDLDPSFTFKDFVRNI